MADGTSVLPAPEGMIHSTAYTPADKGAAPRVCGDGPAVSSAGPHLVGRSPPGECPTPWVRLLPVSAGMAPRGYALAADLLCFPLVRGWSRVPGVCVHAGGLLPGRVGIVRVPVASVAWVAWARTSEVSRFGPFTSVSGSSVSSTRAAMGD